MSKRVQGWLENDMRNAIYNSGIPNMLNRGPGVAYVFGAALRFSSLLLCLTMVMQAADWSGPEQELARKIVAVTGPGAVTLTVINRSSSSSSSSLSSASSSSLSSSSFLSSRDSEVINNGLRAALEAAGLHFVKPDQAAASVAISLSENASSWVWVAEIHQGAGEASVVMVSIPRQADAIATQDSVPLTIRKISLWAQAERILDVAVLEENAAPTHIAVLDANNVSLYRWQGSKWQPEQSLTLTHVRPWPRDLRGRLVPSKDHLLDAYLPGVICHVNSGMSLAINCRESDDPWPLVTASFSNGSPNIVLPNNVLPNNVLPNNVLPKNASTQTSNTSMNAFFASTRNFFTGALAPGVGKFKTVPKFYSAAFLAREKYVLWLFATVDGPLHMVDGVSDQTTKLSWGSDLATVKTSCGSGWQVLAASAGSLAGDAIRAYEFPDRDPVAVSPSVDLSGEITALWTEAKGDTAIAVTRNRETGSYEAVRLAVACSQ